MARVHPKIWRIISGAVQYRRYSSQGSSGWLFYCNKQLEVYAAKPTNRLSLRQLVFFGRSITGERLLKSANYVRQELPVRIAHRIRDMQALPYVVVTEEHVAKVYELYWSAFEKIRQLPPITTMTENDEFCAFLKGLLDEHLPVIPNLSLGLSISSPHISPDKLDAFMRRMLVSRISRRVLAEHHIALSDALAGRDGDQHLNHVGIIYTDLKVKDSIDRCMSFLKLRPAVDPELGISGDWPNVVVDGDVETSFAYIKEHLDYVIYELLHNAMLCTSIRHRNEPSASPPTILATIVAAPDDVHLRISDQGGGLLLPEIESPLDLYSFSHIRNATRLKDDRLGALRSVTSSQRMGIKATVEEKLIEYVQKEADDTNVPTEVIRQRRRFGLGLPMSNIFATYFGGSLDLVSLDGWGTDVYLRLPKLGTNLEGVEV